MLGSPLELIFLLMLAFVFLGPERMAELTKIIGKAIAEFKKASQDLQSTVQEDLAEPITSIINDAVKIEDIKEGFKTDDPH